MKKQTDLTPLETAAYQLADEVWEGRWDHVEELKNAPIGEWTVIPAELERRIPGHLPTEYVHAVAKMMSYH